MDNTGSGTPEAPDSLLADLKRLLVANLMLQVAEAEIGDDMPLFGPGGLGLDSVDALQMVVMLDKEYGLKVADPETAKQILQSVSTMARAIRELRAR